MANKITWKEARLKSGVKTSHVINALGYRNRGSLYSKEKRNTFSWKEAAILCRIYNVSVDQIKI